MKSRLLTAGCIAALLWSSPGLCGVDDDKIETGARAIGRELRRYVRDGRSIATAPLHWDRGRWRKAGLTALGLGIVLAADDEIQEMVQKNRGDFTSDVSDFVTPWGGQRAQNLSIGFILVGAVIGNENLRDTGRDALETTIFAGRIATPLLKRAVGRSRPVTNEGAYAFDPFSANTSFPSGHATNAFAVASVVAEHYDRPAARIFAWSFASAIAYARVHDNVHYASDVVAGAIIGTAIGRGVVARNREGAKPAIMVAPIVVEDGFGICLSYRFP